MPEDQKIDPSTLFPGGLRCPECGFRLGVEEDGAACGECEAGPPACHNCGWEA